MNWINEVFINHSALQAVIVLTFLCAVGLSLGKVKILGVSLGATFVFFMGIVAGHFGMSIDQNILYYMQSFGLVLFIYALGIQVGPGFFSSFRKGGITLNFLGLSVVVLGLLMAVIASFATGMNLADLVGVLCTETGCLFYIIGIAVLPECFANVCRPATLPDDCVIYGLARVFIPDNGCLALIGYTYAGYFVCGNAAFRNTFRKRRILRRIYLHRVMLNPAGLRIKLCELVLRHADDGKAFIKKDTPCACCAFVESENIFFQKITAFLFILTHRSHSFQYDF